MWNFPQGHKSNFMVGTLRNQYVHPKFRPSPPYWKEVVLWSQGCLPCPSPMRVILLPSGGQQVPGRACSLTDPTNLSQAGCWEKLPLSPEPLAVVSWGSISTPKESHGTSVACFSPAPGVEAPGGRPGGWTQRKCLSLPVERGDTLRVFPSPATRTIVTLNPFIKPYVPGPVPNPSVPSRSKAVPLSPLLLSDEE